MEFIDVKHFALLFSSGEMAFPKSSEAGTITTSMAGVHAILPAQQSQND